MSSKVVWAQVEDLPRVEAAELLRARVAGWAADFGEDVVFLKGRAMSHHGLAAAKISSDVDVLAAGRGLQVLRNRLLADGWRERPWEDLDGIFPQHAVSFYHHGWPIDVDLHFRFPGCEAAPKQLLAALTEGSEYLLEAGTAVRVTGMPATVAVHAIGLLRRGTGEAELAAVARFAQEVAPLGIDRAVIDFARRADALAALEPFLRFAFPSVTPDDCGPPSQDWLLYRNSESASVRMEFLLHPQGRSVVRMLRHALWPTREALAATNLHALEMTATELRKARLERLACALRRSPRIVGETWAYMRERRRMVP